MKYLQIIGTLICILLSVISLQLRGLSPITKVDVRRAIQGKDENEIEEIIDRLPLINVHELGSVHDTLDVTISR